MPSFKWRAPGCPCCSRACWFVEDDFLRANSTNLGSDWDELSGDWAIDSNELECVTEGVVVTTHRQPDPVRGTKYNLRIIVDLIDFPSSGTRTWKVICGFEDVLNFDWIALDYDSATSLLIPTFWRRTAGVDATVMDPADYPGNQGFSPITGGTASHTIYICYADLQWSVQASETGSGWVICGGGKSNLPANEDHGLVGFLGETDARFDNWEYWEHWESNPVCFYCTCVCLNVNSETDYKCMPYSLTGTLVRTNGEACSNLDDLEFTLYNAALDGDCDDPLTGYDDSSDKSIWVSELLQVPTNGEQVDTHYYFRFELTCDLVYGFTFAIKCADANIWYESPASINVDWDNSTCSPLDLEFPGLETGYATCALPGTCPCGCSADICWASGDEQQQQYKVVITE